MEAQNQGWGAVHTQQPVEIGPPPSKRSSATAWGSTDTPGPVPSWPGDTAQLAGSTLQGRWYKGDKEEGKVPYIGPTSAFLPGEAQAGEWGLEDQPRAKRGSEGN